MTTLDSIGLSNHFRNPANEFHESWRKWNENKQYNQFLKEARNKIDRIKQLDLKQDHLLKNP